MITINGVTRTWEGLMDCRPENRTHVFDVEHLVEQAKPHETISLPYEQPCVCGMTTWGESMVVNPS